MPVHARRDLRSAAAIQCPGKEPAATAPTPVANTGRTAAYT